MPHNLENDKEVREMSKHTDGPWLKQPGFLTVYTYEGNCGASNAIAVACSEGNEHRGSVVSRTEAEANAHLIAAAPEMLDALEAITEHLTAVLKNHPVPVQWPDNFPMSVPTIKAATEAIRKARNIQVDEEASK